MEFKVGQKYVVDLEEHGERGNIIEITTVEDNHCYYKTIKGDFGRSYFSINSTFASNLVPYKDKKIIITTDGTTTTARLYEGGKNLIKTAEAKCSPADTFDFETGAKLACQRLFKEKTIKTPLFKVGDKVRVIGNTRPMHCYKIGDIVEVKGICKNGCLECKNNISYQIVSPADVEHVTFKVGDRVRIINGGEIYSTNYSWIENHVNDKHLLLSWSFKCNPYYDKERMRHVANDDTFIIRIIAEGKAFVQNADYYNGECYLVGFAGLQKE